MGYVGIAAFVATLVVFVAYGLDSFRHNKGHREFFHASGVWANIIALVVATVTLGTGLAYLLVASSKNGLAMLAIPVGVAVGFVLLARFMRALPAHITAKGGNLLLRLREQIETERNDQAPSVKTLFDITVVLPLVIVYLLVFAFEIFVSSQLIAAVVLPNSGAHAAHVIAAAMFVAALIYCLLGGAEAVYRTAKVQFVGIIAFIVIVAYGVTTMRLTASATPVAHLPMLRLDGQIAINCVLAFIDAIATQFYSLINVYNASNSRNSDEQAVVFKRNAIILTGLL